MVDKSVRHYIYIIALLVIVAASLFLFFNISVGKSDILGFQSVELGIAAVSTAGTSGGLVLPASCEGSGREGRVCFDHSPPPPPPSSVTYSLVVNKAGTGVGSVTGPGYNCGTSATNCSVMYPSGTGVTLVASVAGGNTFGGWSGCGSVSGTNCFVSMTSARTVTATFNATAPPPPLLPSATISASPNPCTVTSGSTCSSTINWNIQPVAGYVPWTSVRGGPYGSPGTQIAGLWTGGLIRTDHSPSYTLVYEARVCNFGLSGCGFAGSVVLASVSVTAVSGLGGPPPPPPPPPPLPPAVSIIAAPAIVKNGNTTTVNWSATNVKSCVVSGNGVSIVDAPLPNGSAETAPITKEEIYSISCIALDDSPVGGSVTIRPIGKPVEF